MNFIAGLAQLLLKGRTFWLEDPTPGNPTAEWVPPVYSRSSPFVNYQVDAPTTDYGAPVYSQELLQHVFGDTWGVPHKVDYSPPPADVTFSHVKLYLEVSSFGIQYDRLAHIQLNDVEIWRPSTSEPRGLPSFSNHTKDVSSQLALFTGPGELSFELNNLVTERLNGTFDVKLNALYFNVPAEQVSPNDWYEHEGVPATNVQRVLDVRVASDPLRADLPRLPLNTTRAVLQIYASGNGNDEFWYAQSSHDEENAEHGALRHIVAKVDGDLAGVVSPSYQIYTGGFQPKLWSPFVAPNAYDVPCDHIDLTPFLPSLWESLQSEQDSGNDHDRDAAGVPLELYVVDGYDRIVHHEWIVSAALLTWETHGVEGRGTRFPTQETNQTSKVQLPSIEVTEFSQSINVTSDLLLDGPDGASTRVEWTQKRDTSCAIVGGTTITHNSRGKSSTSYATRSYGRDFAYDLALVLEESGVTVAEGYNTHDLSVEPTVAEDLLSRAHHVHYNGSWFEYGAAGAGPMTRSRRQRINGSDVFVKYRDPLRMGQQTYHQHAISRNGSVVTLNAPHGAPGGPGDESALDEIDYMAAVVDSTRNTANNFPLKPFTEHELASRRNIRRKWLKHAL